MRLLTNISILLAVLFTWGCQDEPAEFGDVTPPTDLQIQVNIANATEQEPFGDGSGRVEFTATAANAISYIFDFGDNVRQTVPSGQVSHTYGRVGENDYLVTVIATGRGGITTTETIDITVLSNFEDPETKAALAGGGEKVWRVAVDEPGHLGVGPLDTYTPDFFSASPGLLADCLYDDEITIAEDDNGNLSFSHANNGLTFFNAEFVSVGGGGGDEDQCLPFSTEGEKTLSLGNSTFDTPQELTTGTQFIISDDGFMSYYINTSTYEILEITDNYMHVRAISGSSGNPLAWYLKFTTDAPGTGGNELETEFNDLIWSEEFDEVGRPDQSIWNYEIGNGNNGWGNREVQYYTEENVSIVDGAMKITLEAEERAGFDYTSSRLNTLGKFDFQYGRIEFRAKLPEGGGTWPALWMMGVDFPDAGWPFCGEIDVMEHRGNQQDVIHGSLHFPGNSGGNAVTSNIEEANVSSEFKLYTVEWTEEHILFAVNNQVYHEFENSADLPYNQPFFIIVNVAMGGTFGGDVDPDFNSSVMEIDHIRVYQ
jgi:hypothetical protein